MFRYTQFKELRRLKPELVTEITDKWRKLGTLTNVKKEKQEIVAVMLENQERVHNGQEPLLGSSNDERPIESKIP